MIFSENRYPLFGIMLWLHLRRRAVRRCSRGARDAHERHHLPRRSRLLPSCRSHRRGRPAGRACCAKRRFRRPATSAAAARCSGVSRHRVPDRRAGGRPQRVRRGLEYCREAGPRVFPEVAKFTRVCALIVRNAGRREAEPERPGCAAHHGGDRGRRLHALLTAAGEAGPYVLVAHSYGGLIGGFMPAATPTTYPVSCSSTRSPKAEGCADARAVAISES